MRIHGTLAKWNDERGFGFIALPQSHEEVFIHISAFPRDGIRPRIGEIISFEVGSGSDGRKRAEKVSRPPAKPLGRKGGHKPTNSKQIPLGAALTTLVILALGVVGYRAYTSTPHHVGDSAGTFTTPQTAQRANQQFNCDGRTHCSQMTSCAEAMYFLKHCPNTKMDGNNDGEPCEQQWCN